MGLNLPRRLGWIAVYLLPLVLLVAVLGPLAGAQTAPAPTTNPKAADLSEKRPTLIFILDGSGSMWGRIDGRPKIVIAKKVLSDMIAEIGDETDIGLVSYGHRREGDCADVEVLVRPGQVDQEVFKKKLASLNPKGKTPISQAIRETVELAKGSAGPVTLVLVSDGKETCGGDPCWLAEHLRRTVLDFKMQVVGFDVSPEETEQLECIAGAGAGSYYSARSALELEIAVRQITEETLLPQGPALAVGAVKNGREIKSQITILTRQGQDLEVVAFGDTERFNPQLFHLEPGEYQVRVTEDQGGPGRTITRAVDYQGRNKAVVVVFEEGLLRLGTVKNGLPAPARIEAREVPGPALVLEAETRTQNPIDLALPPGRYEVRVHDLENEKREAVILSGVVVENAATTEQVVDFPEGRILVQVLVNGRPAQGGLDVFDSKTGEWVRSADTSAGNPVPVPLLPGEYDLKVVAPRLLGRPPLEFKSIRVEPGGEPGIRADFEEARLDVRVLINGRPGRGRVEVSAAGTDRRVFSGEAKAEEGLSLRLAPGTYDIRVSNTNVSASPVFPFRLEEGLELDPGAEEELVFQFQEGDLTLRPQAWPGSMEGVFYLYPSGSGEEIESGSLGPGQEKALTLEPGLYDLVVEVSQGQERKILRQEGIEILAGFRTLVELPPDSPEAP